MNDGIFGTATRKPLIAPTPRATRNASGMATASGQPQTIHDTPIVVAARPYM